MKQFSISKQRGLTLIEASVSAAVVGIALLGILRLQMQLSKDNADSPVRTAALNAAQQKMEQLRFQAATPTGYAALNGGNDDNTPSSLPVLQNATLNRSWTVEDKGNYKSVTVTVSWANTRSTDGKSNETVRLSSYIAKTDPKQAGTFLASLPSSNP
ncbi:MAG: type IV pilus modification PilV family protein [Aquaspirillum sp.]